jgi:formate C-acetyltransferase
MSGSPTRRIERLREAFLSLNHNVSIDRARIETRSMQESEGEPMLSRKAKVLKALVNEMPIEIWRDELILGFPAARPRCENVGPSEGPSIEDEFGYSLSGAWPYRLDDDVKKELREEIIPYWKGRGQYERTSGGRAYSELPPELAPLFLASPEKYPPEPSMVYLAPGIARSYHYGHNVINYPKVLKIGFLGIVKEAKERMAALDPGNPDSIDQRLFLKSVVTVMAAASGIGRRFAARARELSEEETDLERKRELLRIADVCDWVPANPARTFHEALQSCYFAWILLLWETPFVNGQSPGRADQYLRLYYERDIRRKAITSEEAQELLDCYILKLNHTSWLDSHLSVGGVKADGSDASNELSYMFIEAMMHVRLTAPHLSVLVHSRTPDELLIKAAELCAMGTGHPMFFNSDVVVDQSLSRGTVEVTPITLEQARSTAMTGCIESVIPGMDAGPAFFSGACNIGALMEFVLTNGYSRHYKRKMGAETGNPKEFKSFEDIQEAFRKQMEFFAKNNAIVGNIGEKATAEFNPTIYESALLDDCIQKGMPKEVGGARYNSASISPIGPADAANSLAAIKKVIFEDKRVTMGELCDALERDFEGYDDLRRMLRGAPKYGNDDDYADEQMAFVANVIASELIKHKNTRGGRYFCMGSPVSNYVPCGKVVGALPSGRLAQEPLSDGWSASAGTDMQGPTALLRSMSKVDNVALHSVLNLRIDPMVFRDEEGLAKFIGLIRTMVDLRVFELQVNVISSNTLRAAQQEPDKYRDIVVKVAGYNAFFTELNKAIQDSIIARTEHILRG